MSNVDRTIGVYRALQLGDLLCSIPAIRALRRAYPEAHITLIGLPWAVTFVDRFRKYFDEFLPAPGLPGLPEQPFDPVALVAFIAELQERSFDFLLQMHGNGNVINPVLAMAGAKRFAGYYREGNYRPDPDTFMRYPDAVNPEPLRHLRLMEFLGIPADGAELEFPLTTADCADFDRLCLSLAPKRYVCIHPGARAAGRQWPVENFARLGDLAHGLGYRVVLTGVEAERELAFAVGHAMERQPIDLTGRTSLGALGVLVQDARLVIANDTGISHVATALRTPSIIVSLAHDAERWKPLDSERHTTLNGFSPTCLDEAAGRLQRLVG